MRQLRQMLRLAREGVSAREIGRTLGVARSTVQDNLKRAEAAGLRWPLPAEPVYWRPTPQEALPCLRIPTHAGHLFRDDVGHHSDLMPATVPR